MTRPYATRGRGGVVRLYQPPPDPPILVAELDRHEALELATELLRAAGRSVYVGEPHPPIEEPS